jgi:hypothetical protein
VSTSRTFRGVTVVVVAVLLVGCSSVNPPPSPTGTPTTALPTSTASPSATATVAPTFPLAVVTGLTNLKSVIDLDELAALAKKGKLVLPCGVDVVEPKLTSSKPCVWADEMAAAIEANQKLVALLPPGLVEPATKVLPIAGGGPYGLFGPDLFGDPQARALPYPVVGSAVDPYALEPAWTAYDASRIWTLTDIGSLCADRAAAKQAVTLGKGWDWAFNGGTARYNGKPIRNPTPPPGLDPAIIVRPVDTGNAGVTPSILKRSDVAIADHECPILPTKDWAVNTGPALSFAVPEAVLPRWRDFLGLDMTYLAANHMSDRGVSGIRSTLKLIDKYKIPRTGLGLNLDQAIEPAYYDVAGLKIGLVAWNDVGGVARADADTAGVPWITKANVVKALKLARAGGADVVICAPQWWGGAEYHDDLWPNQVKQLGWFDDAGCDHVIGAGTHVAGPLLLRNRGDDVSLVLASPGNYMFGQSWWQEVQEGVILDMSLRGKTLVNVRLHPYVMILAARPSLLDPEGDGHYVLQRIWKKADIDYTLKAGGA